jgi:hypothetical protein
VNAVTEAEWLTCADPITLLGYLQDKGSPRKRQLFCLACWEDARLLHDEIKSWLDDLKTWPEEADWLDDTQRPGMMFDAYHHVDLEVDATYGFWDLFEGDDDALAAVLEAGAEPLTSWSPRSIQAGAVSTTIAEALYAGWVRSLYVMHDPPNAAELAARIALQAEARGAEVLTQWREQQRRHADLVREVFGNPFRSPGIAPAWLLWNDGTVTKLAHSIYDEGAFDQMPILADALEEAGCTDAAVLDHCRGSAGHFRGCWVVDLLLRKE